MNVESRATRVFDEPEKDKSFSPDATRLAQTRAKARRTGRIALFGLFGVGNLGNDGSLEAMISHLRRTTDAELFCVCPRPDLVARDFSLAALPMRYSGYLKRLPRWLNRLLLKMPGMLFDLAQTYRQVRRADLMIIPGTGILDDFGERPTGMPYDILKWCLAARLARTRVAFVSIGAGPIRNRLSRFLMVSAARLAHYRSYRDLQSREFMESIGFDVRGDAVYPDLAFALPTPMSAPRKPSGALRVGIGVMTYRGWYGFDGTGDATFSRYVGKLSAFVVYLLDCGHDVRILTGEDGDRTAVDALRAAVQKSRPEIDASRLENQQVHSLRDVMEQIALTDIVVATRFHNIVCALKMFKPTISLGYAKKNDVLLAAAGLREFCQHIDDFDVGTLIEQFSQLVADRQEHEQRIRDRIADFGMQCDDQYACLNRLMF